MKASFIALLFVSITFAGCGKQLEFPKGNLLSVKPTQDPNQYQLGFEEVMEFREGELAEYAIVAKVPQNSPVVTVEGLPGSATFSEKDMRICWKPTAGTAKATAIGQAGYSTYPIRIHLRASSDPLDVVIRKAVLVVFEGSKTERLR